MPYLALIDPDYVCDVPPGVRYRDFRISTGRSPNPLDHGVVLLRVDHLAAFGAGRCGQRADVTR
jgi:hypothetical protein